MALFFSDDDAMELKKLPLMKEILEHEAIRTKKMGSLISVLCPFHDDRHFGSCFVKKNNKGLFCHVCNKSISTTHFLTNARGYRYYDSLSLMAELSGTAYMYESDGKKSAKPNEKHRYSWQDACFLGFAPQVKGIEEKYSCSYFETADKTSKEVQEDGTVLYFHNNTGGNPLSALEREDPEAFSHLMEQKAKEKMLDAIVTYDMVKNPKYAPSFLKEGIERCEEGRIHILEQLKESYEKVAEIYKKYSGKEPPTKKELAAELYITNAFSYA